MSRVRPAVTADVTRLVRTATMAFVDDPLMRWMFPGLDEYLSTSPGAWRFLLDRSMAFDATFTTDDGVAVAIFSPPGRPTVEPPLESAIESAIELETSAEPAETSPRPAPSPELLARYEAIGAVLHEHTPGEPHWYLNVLGTHPDWQRQGLGAAVIGPIGEVCRRDGVPMYLETQTIENVAYYSHLGFRVRSEFDVPLDGPHMWAMIRNP